MANVTVEINSKEVEQRLNILRERISNLAPFFKKAAIIMKKDILNHFDEKKSSNNSSWPSVSLAYAELKKKKGKDPSNLLQFSGALKNSIRDLSTGENAVIGTNLSYASQHQFGTRRIPKREFLWLSQDAMDKILDVIKKEIDK